MLTAVAYWLALQPCILVFKGSQILILVGASGFQTTLNLNHACFIATLDIWKTKIHWRDVKNRKMAYGHLMGSNTYLVNPSSTKPLKSN